MILSPAAARPLSGRVINVEGLSGVGKTHLTDRALHLVARPPLIAPPLSARRGSGGLDAHLIDALMTASCGDHFLRGGFPASETLLHLALQMNTIEKHHGQLASGAAVLEGRGLYSVAVYQALILHPAADTRDAADCAAALLAAAARFRPLPACVILVTDEVDLALSRAEARDASTYSPEQRRLHHRAAALFEELAAREPRRFRILDRRRLIGSTAIALLADWISQAVAR